MALNAYCPALVIKHKYSVPNLQFYLFTVVDINRFGCKLNSYCNIIMSGKLAFHIPDEHRRFSNS
jgi:hypothetical protein